MTYDSYGNTNESSKHITLSMNMVAFGLDSDATYKDQCIKMLEETAEVFSAVEDYDKNETDFKKHLVLNEIADVIQATVNLAFKMDFDERDIAEAMIRCTNRNRIRGRF